MSLMPRYGKLVFKKDEFEVWESMEQLWGPRQYCWQLQDNDRAYGPFANILDAVTHYKGWQAARNSTDNIIFVNFKTKKRVSNPNV